MNKWKRVSRERVFDHKFFKVNKDIVELPNSEQIEWLFWDSIDSSMTVAEDTDGKLVMIRQYRYLPDEEALEFPSGRAQEGESQEENALRELEEETGYSAEKIVKVGSFFETMAQLNRKIHIFIALGAKPVTNRKHFLDSGDGQYEYIEVELVDPNELEEKIISGEIHSMGTCLAYFLYKKTKEKNA